jgi:hypothetical protein
MIDAPRRIRSTIVHGRFQEPTATGIWLYP